MVDGEGEEGALMDGCEVVGAFIFVCVVLLNKVQRFTQLQHCRKFVLAVITTEAGAGELTDLTIVICELDLVVFSAFYDGITFVAVKGDVSDFVFHIVIVSALCDPRGDIHFCEIAKTEGGIVTSADDLLVIACRCFESRNGLTIWQCFTVKGYEMRPCHKEFAVHVGINHGNDSLIIGDFDFEIVVDIGDAAAYAFQLALDIRQVAAMQVESVVVI